MISRARQSFTRLLTWSEAFNELGCYSSSWLFCASTSYGSPAFLQEHGRAGTSPAMKEKYASQLRLEVSDPVLYDMYHLIKSGSFHDRPDCRSHCRNTSSRSLPDRPANRRARSTGGDGNAGHQYPAALAATDGDIAEGVERGGHLCHHGVPRGIRARPARGRTDFGSLRPALAGADRFRGVPVGKHLVRPRRQPACSPRRPRHPGRRRLRDIGAVARHRPRPV